MPSKIKESAEKCETCLSKWKEDCPCVPVPLLIHDSGKEIYKLAGLYETEEEADRKATLVNITEDVQVAQRRTTAGDFNMWAVYRQVG